LDTPSYVALLCINDYGTTPCDELPLFEYVSKSYALHCHLSNVSLNCLRVSLNISMFICH